MNRIYQFGDLLILNLSVLGISLFLNSEFDFTRERLLQLLGLNLGWLIATSLFYSDESNRSLKFESIANNIIKSLVVHSLLLIFFFYLTQSKLGKWPEFYMVYLGFVFLLFMWRSFMMGLLKFLRRRGLNYRRIVMIGGGPQTEDLFNFFVKHDELGFKLQGIFIDDVSSIPNIPLNMVRGSIENANTFLIDHGTDEVYCSLSTVDFHKVNNLLRFCDQNFIRFKLIPDFRGFFNKKVSVDFYESIPVLNIRKEPLESTHHRAMKRLFDIVFSFLVIVLIFPWLLTIIAIAIKMSSPGPVFFKQERSGKNNESFVCLKFRTMRVNREADELQASRNDPRITKVGNFLRKTSLDELPQFFNAFVGDMSVVGPRPHMLKHTEEYSELIEKFMVRHLVKPGITGWAQIWGLRGETNDPNKMKRRVEFDVWYIENWSLLLDIKIIFYTVVNMIKGEDNAH